MLGQPLETVKPILELLGGVPTVVFGYFALLFITPLLQTFIPGLTGFNLLAPGIVLGIMIMPYIVSISEDAMRAVPASQGGSLRTWHDQAANVVQGDHSRRFLRNYRSLPPGHVPCRR